MWRAGVCNAMLRARQMARKRGNGPETWKRAGMPETPHLRLDAHNFVASSAHRTGVFDMAWD